MIKVTTNIKIKTIILSLILTAYISYGQETERSAMGVELFPASLEFLPLRADIQEPRIGIYRMFDKAQMKVDIGNSVDLLKIPFDSVKDNFLNIGIDFFAYAFVVDAQGLRLQIDAVDGFFGGHIVTTFSSGNQPFQLRLRLLHQSAHLVDGDYQGNGVWTNQPGPIPYTRDFGELTLTKKYFSESLICRPYIGLSYATLVRPTEIQRFAYFIGGEIADQNLPGKTLGNTTNIYLAYHLALTGAPAYKASHQVQTGVKFGNYYDKGLVFYLAYYHGNHFFAEYFDEQISTIGAGFMVDF